MVDKIDRYPEEAHMVKKLQPKLKILSPDIPEELDQIVLEDRQICNEDYFEIGIISDCIYRDGYFCLSLTDLVWNLRQTK
jgi:hypothetical protein